MKAKIRPLKIWPLKILRWHRKLAWIAGVTVILWAASGLLHPVMNFGTPQPTTWRPPVVVGAVDGLLAPSQLAINGDIAGDIISVRLLSHNNKPVYQVTAKERQYYDAKTGVLLENLDQERAKFLATHYTNKNTEQAVLTKLKVFSLDYPSINKHLPAWKVQIDDTLVYVETGGDSLVRLSNPTRQQLLKVFQVVHTLPFLPEVLQKPVITVLTGSILLTGLFGLYLLLRWKKRRGVLYRFHQVTGIVVIIPFLAYPISGLFHLWGYQDALEYLPESFKIAQLDTAPDQLESRAIVINSVSYWRSAKGNWLDTSNQPTNLTDKSIAIQTVCSKSTLFPTLVAGSPSEYGTTLAARSSGGPATSVGNKCSAQTSPSCNLHCVQDDNIELVRTFTKEYGFSNRILPVWRVPRDNKIHFIDAKNARIVNTIDQFDKAELWSFNMLHKWQFLRGWGMKKRDILQIVITGLIVLMAILGLCLKKRRHAQ